GSKVLLDLNPSRAFFIGSVRKVFTVGQLLNAIGGAHRYDTPIYRTGSVSHGVLHGNLIVVASGDLTMGGRTLPDGRIAVSNWDHNEADGLGNAILTQPDPLAGYRRLAQQVRAAGITHVAGNVAIDDRLFQPFFFRDQFYVRPIFVNDDVVDLSMRPGGTPGSKVAVAVRPLSAALRIDDKLLVGAPKSADTLAIKPTLPACIGSLGCTSTISGSLPSDFVPPLTGTPTLVQTVRIVQPSNYARTVLIEMLQAAGVKVDAPAVASNPVALLPARGSYSAGNRVAQLSGMPYAQDAKFILKISYNIGADTSLVLFGLTQGVRSMPDALRAEQRNLSAHYGIAPSDYHFVDGSGGGDTTATNAAVTQVLQRLATSSAASDLYNALPVLGVDGSLAFVKDFQKDPSLAGAKGNVHAKTGTYVDGTGAQMTLKGQAFGGYITTKRGHHLTYELVVNNVPIRKIDDITGVFQDEGTISALLWRDY
ncbi:MAG TPA: D-alanyl-D-alanine carboxypeptidase, partial [Candidatus Tumulicola sp.]|nr:D-alanyl-D-alanine carboxypeptidase [Candidatus Tumulicola sp.]